MSITQLNPPPPPEPDHPDGPPATVLPFQPRAVYTVQELAEFLALSLTSTYTALRDGTIPARKVGARWIISRRRIDAWLDEITVPADPEPWDRGH
jgi:excisionase family DNA binding protein